MKCPACGALPGAACLGSRGKERTSHHQDRIDAARAKPPERPDAPRRAGRRSFPPDAQLTLRQTKALLEGAGLDIAKEERLPNDKGFKLSVRDRRANVNVWDNGSWHVQGEEHDRTVVREALLGAATAAVSRWTAVAKLLRQGSDGPS